MSTKIISIIDPDVLAIPIQECGEAMMDLKEQQTILLGDSPEIPNNQDYTKVRVTVYEKLLAAQKNLPSQLRFCLYEGYRSLQLQEQLFNQRYHILKQNYPNWEHSEIFQETIKLISPVINLDGSVNIPPHNYMATLIRTNNLELLFDRKSVDTSDH